MSRKLKHTHNEGKGGIWKDTPSRSAGPRSRSLLVGASRHATVADEQLVDAPRGAGVGGVARVDGLDLELPEQLAHLGPVVEAEDEAALDIA